MCLTTRLQQLRHCPYKAAVQGYSVALPHYVVDLHFQSDGMLGEELSQTQFNCFICSACSPSRQGHPGVCTNRLGAVVYTLEICMKLIEPHL